jgi:hypothetical protein
LQRGETEADCCLELEKSRAEKAARKIVSFFRKLFSRAASLLKSIGALAPAALFHYEKGVFPQALESCRKTSINTGL